MKLNTFAIKKLMADRRLTVSKLAELAGVTRQSMSTILARGTCSIANAGRISDALGTELEVIAREVV